MSRATYSGPKLPRTLLDQVGASGNIGKSHVRNVSRKDRRQAERRQKRNAGDGRSTDVRVQKDGRSTGTKTQKHSRSTDDGKNTDVRGQHNGKSTSRREHSAQVDSNTTPPKSILKKRKTVPIPESSDADSSDEEVPAKPVISRGVKNRLEEDDAEIAALERKLGIKNKRSKSLEEDGLDWIATGAESDDGHDGVFGSKHDRDEDDVWLQNKRRKASMASLPHDVTGDTELNSDDSMDLDDEDTVDMEEDQAESDLEGLENPFSDDELSDEDDFGFSGSEDNGTQQRQASRVRENPYVAPVDNQSRTSKYIPPSKRKAELGETEDLSQLKRQLQGQLNRLSDANFLSILQAVEDIYNKNARQHVSSSLIELLSGLINTASTLSETFLILHAGFAVAVYKVIGPDFAASLLEKLTKAIDALREDAQPGKQVLNIVGFLANAYVLQLIGPGVIFDYIRLFLAELSEDNTELLLRIIRTAGSQLRSDDPTSLKDIVLLLTRSVASREEGTLSVRTKFMIETINDLKNNRMKTNVVASGITSEHVIRMKKILGTLNARTTLRATEPLQITLADINESEKKGKWWLVGASYHDPSKLSSEHPAAGNSQTKTSSRDQIDDGYESETPGHVSLQKLARSQGMNTDVRRSIFISIMSASDYEDAHLRISKLSLKNKQIAEVSRVLLHCVGAESTYNPYYTIVAKTLCAEKRLQKAFQSSLWDTLRKLDLSAHAEYDDDDNPASSSGQNMSLPTIVNLGRLFGTLLADACLPLSSLKTIDLTYPSANMQTFTEVLFTTVMVRCSKQEDSRSALETVFAQIASAPGMIAGLQLFLEKTLSSADIAQGAKQRKAVRSGCRVALETLTRVGASSALMEDSDMSMSEGDYDDDGDDD